MNTPPDVRRWANLAFWLSALLLILQLAVPALAEPAYPPLTGRVTDAAGVLPADVVTRLEGKLKTLEDTTGTQLVVATVPDLGGYEIEDYGVGLIRHWGIGQKGQNNGAILIIAPAQRKLRIEVGYGLEGTLTDAVSSRIIRGAIVPRLKAGDLAGGVEAGADQLIGLLQLPPDQQAAAVKKLSRRRAASDDSPGLGAIVWLAIIITFVVLASRRGKRGRGWRGRGWGGGPVIIWGPDLGGSWSNRGGSDWGGGGGGFGGFSGGGGSGGGGGASGSW